MTPKQTELHTEALILASQFRKVELKLINVLQEIENEKVYLELNYSSLFEYGVSELHLSDGNAYIFQRIAKKFTSVPELKVAMKEGKITVSNAKQIVPILTEENKLEWLEKAETLSKRELEKEINKDYPEVVKETVRQIAEARSSVHLGMSDQALEKLRRAQSLVSKAEKRFVSLEETIEKMSDLFLEKKDPVEKAKRVFPGTKVASEEIENLPTPQKGRHPIPAALKHQVALRDQGDCTYGSSEGKKCGNSFFTEIHHVLPVSRGGTNTLENLQTLCSRHHAYIHNTSVPTTSESQRRCAAARAL